MTSPSEELMSLDAPSTESPGEGLDYSLPEPNLGGPSQNSSILDAVSDGDSFGSGSLPGSINTENSSGSSIGADPGQDPLQSGAEDDPDQMSTDDATLPPTTAHLLDRGDLSEDSSDEDYLPADESGSGASPSKVQRQRRPTPGVTYRTSGPGIRAETNKTFRGASQRSTPVGIDLETINHVTLGPFQRPTAVEGWIEPQGTKGRPNAPEPVSGIKVGVAYKNVGGASRNTGLADMHKGHLMALELGGPDIPENIVPQYAQFQANGAWRAAETKALEHAQEASERGSNVYFHAGVHYKPYPNPEMGTRRGLTIPGGFTMTTTEYDENENAVEERLHFDADQAQDGTDDKMFDRLADPLDEEMASDSDSEMASDSDSEMASDQQAGEQGDQADQSQQSW